MTHRDPVTLTTALAGAVVGVDVPAPADDAGLVDLCRVVEDLTAGRISLEDARSRVATETPSVVTMEP